MSNEKTNVQSERKDYPILEKMKNLPGGLHPAGYRSCNCNIYSTVLPDRWICNSIVL